MRALTVRQPWAWAIVHGGKDVENRSRNVAGAYRGPVAIHAGKVYDPDAVRSPAMMTAWLDAFEGGIELDYGHIIGVVDLVDAHLECEGYCGPWAQVDAWHLVLRSPRPLAKPIPWRGRLGLSPVPGELEAAIRAQLGDALPAVTP